MYLQHLLLLLLLLLPLPSSSYSSFSSSSSPPSPSCSSSSSSSSSSSLSFFLAFTRWPAQLEPKQARRTADQMSRPKNQHVQCDDMPSFPPLEPTPTSSRRVPVLSTRGKEMRCLAYTSSRHGQRRRGKKLGVWPLDPRQSRSRLPYETLVSD